MIRRTLLSKVCPLQVLHLFHMKVLTNNKEDSKNNVNKDENMNKMIT
jgi:hypothetical protein